MSVVGVYQIPSSYELSWRDSLYSNALESGWKVFEGSLPEGLDASFNYLLLTSDPAQITDITVDLWVVLGRSPSEAAAWLQQVLSLHGDGGIHIASNVMAAADCLVQKGAKFFDSCDDEVEVPLLGRVWRGEVKAVELSDVTVLKRAHKVLAHFENLPTRPSIWVDWRAGFLKDSGTGKIATHALDLTGRNRVLLEGDFPPLSPGFWRVDSEWIVADTTSEVSLEFRWGPHGNAIGHSKIIHRTGRYRVTLDAEWVNIAPATLCVSLKHPCFHGTLDLVALRLGRLDRVPAIKC